MRTETKKVKIFTMKMVKASAKDRWRTVEPFSKEKCRHFSSNSISNVGSRAITMMKTISRWAVLAILIASCLYAEENDNKPAPKIHLSGYIQSLASSIQNDIQVSTDTFSINRTRLRVEAVLGPSINGYIEGELTDAELTDAYISYNPYSWIGFLCGQMKIPLGYETSIDESEQDFIEYSRVVEKLIIESPGMRDIGVYIISTGSFWDTGIMVSNGAGTNTDDDDENKAFSGRAAVYKEHMRIGASFYRTKRTITATMNEQKIIRYAGEVRLGDETGFLKGEYIFGKDGGIKKDGFTISGDTGLPFISPMAYHMIPLRVFVRFEQWDPDTNIDDDAESLIVFGLRYPFSDNLKIDLNYAIIQEEADTQIKNNRFLAQLQLRF